MTEIKKGKTDVTRYVMIYDADGDPATGVTITGLKLAFVRTRTLVTQNSASALGAVDAAHVDNNAIEVSGTYHPGLYRIDWPDAAFADGSGFVSLRVTGTGLYSPPEHVQLVEELSGLLVADAFDVDMTGETDITKLLGQIRMIHAHTGGTLVVWDPAAPNVNVYRNEADSADLSVKTRTTAAGNVRKITRSAP